MLDRLRTQLAGTTVPANPTAEAYRDIPPALRRFASDYPRQAAVLVPVIQRKPMPSILLTRRTDNLPDHPGQVSFPGGSVEPDDADAIATALRETQEELGIAASRIEPIGFLRPYSTVTQFVIVPVVAIVQPGALTPNPREVAAAFEIPLDHLLQETIFKRRQTVLHGHEVGYWEITWGEQRVWGATAEMLHRFCQLLA